MFSPEEQVLQTENSRCHSRGAPFLLTSHAMVTHLSVSLSQSTLIFSRCLKNATRWWQDRHCPVNVFHPSSSISRFSSRLASTEQQNVSFCPLTSSRCYKQNWHQGQRTLQRSIATFCSHQYAHTTGIRLSSERRRSQWTHSGKTTSPTLKDRTLCQNMGRKPTSRQTEHLDQTVVGSPLPD